MAKNRHKRKRKAARRRCPMCDVPSKLTKHHVWHKKHRCKMRKSDPRRHEIFRVCRKCHDWIHVHVPSGEDPMESLWR